MFVFRVVIEALKPLEGDRQCHRLINGVLVERTVAQVLPALTNNLEKVKASNVFVSPAKLTFLLDSNPSFRTH